VATGCAELPARGGGRVYRINTRLARLTELISNYNFLCSSYKTYTYTTLTIIWLNKVLSFHSVFRINALIALFPVVFFALSI